MVNTLQNGIKTAREHMILITNRYPYLPGEQFLETEMKYMEHLFEKIEVAAVNGTGEQRPVPEKVQVHQLPGRPGGTKKYIHTFYSVTADPQGRRWLSRELPKARMFGSRGLMQVANWLSHAIRIRDEIKRKWLDDPNFDISNSVFYSYWLTPSAVALAMLKETHRDLLAVSRAHGGDVYDYRHSLPYLPFQERVISSLDSVRMISDDGKNYFESKYPNANAHLLVNRLGTEKPGFTAAPSQDGILRIVSCSYVKPVKRLDLLVQALKQTASPIHWTHIGDGEQREEIENKAKNELPEHVTIDFKGHWTQQQIFEFYQSQPVDLFVNVSESEGIPVTIMEAFSTSIPVIATDVGGVRELVDESNGFLVPSEVSSAELADDIERFAALPDEKKMKYRSNAFAKWEKEYDAKKNYTDFLKSVKKGSGS
ncbi:glycosyltransferase [Fictibacillus sp. KU28468]|uniref:glycosyltransferase n=1 Tax=Fictibacillus sp. KU28468 TaxID=2991053 RepID=UPI00223E3B58|nr:glycosyltransferase [Fictibacillus sp. KU28468]UZJ79665.1 glycosyltransferase [Fictibacillus sp. KU28468]